MRFCKSIFLAAAVCLLPLASQASSIKSDPTLSIGGMTFDDFSCNVTTVHHASPHSCGSIAVLPINWPAPGVQFWSDFNAHSDGYISFDDATINYHVASGTAINSVGLDFDGTFYGYAISAVTESIYSNGMKVGFATIACGTEVGCTYSDTVLLDGSYNNLWVTEHIDVGSFVGVANIAYVTNTFDAATAPEPASIGLVGAALIGVAALYRRRSKQAASA
jgi:PEP-CTERM motif